MNIYVGNLGFKVDEKELEEIFEEYGTVKSTKIITDKYTGKSKGFGFIAMDDTIEAKEAIDKLNGTTLDNREIIVNEARPKKNNFFR
ncbi:MAG: RNA-binding protein [Bacteroidales bacterium]|jgi:RNA recognition motif-containing protein